VALLPIVPYGNPTLRRQAEPVTTIDDDLLRLIDDMAETMRAAGGIGLAAPQVGVSRMVMVIDWSRWDEEHGTLQAYINPEILEYGKKVETYDEGCLSFPKTSAKVPRPDHIKVRYQQIDGAIAEDELDEFPAHVFQHEYDHLLGILFIDRISPSERARIKDNLQAILSGAVKPFDGTQPTEPERFKVKAATLS